MSSLHEAALTFLCLPCSWVVCVCLQGELQETQREKARLQEQLAPSEEPLGDEDRIFLVRSMQMVCCKTNSCSVFAGQLIRKFIML